MDYKYEARQNKRFWHKFTCSGKPCKVNEGKFKSIHDDAYRTLVGLLRAEREAAGVTQVDLAALLGTDQSFVSKYERCERRLDIIELRQICVAIGTNLRDFIDRFEKELKGKGLA